MERFDELGLTPALLKALEQLNFTTPTPIQAQAVPPALLGRDVLGSAQTGTGKTAAFGIPLVNHLQTQSRGAALVLTPTRELAVQVLESVRALMGKRSFIKTALLIGGESMPKQLEMLKARPRLMVGTPGRINDHLERGSLMLHDANFLVLDETDRMLDMGFSVQIDEIMRYLPQQRQTLLFSATLPDHIIKISKKYMNNPVRVAIDMVAKPATNLKQAIKHVAQAEKFSQLMEELKAREGSIIVFVKTKNGAEKMAQRLRSKRMEAEAIHGDLRQSQRDKVIADFRDQQHRILVATDIAARGLDIPHIEHVINYDLPQSPEDFIHRIGRTARAGANGECISLIAPDDHEKWQAIQKMLGQEGALPDIPPADAPRRKQSDKRPSSRSAAPKAESASAEKPRPAEKTAQQKPKTDGLIGLPELPMAKPSPEDETPTRTPARRRKKR